FPALTAPGVRDLAALEHDVVDRALAEHSAYREPRVPGADDDGREAFDVEPRFLLIAPTSSDLEGLDGDVRRVRHDVEHRRALLRLRDERLDLLLRRVGVDIERHRDVFVAVAHVGVDAEDAANIHRALELRLDGTQLDAAVL